MPNGRIMVNCGGATDEISGNVHNEETWLLNSTLQTLFKAFPGQVSIFIFIFLNEKDKI